MNVEYNDPEQLAPGHAFTQAVKVEGAKRLLFISGQIGWDANEQIVGLGDISLQTTRVFENIQEAVTSSGGTMADVVKLTIFITDIKMMQAVREARKAYWEEGKYPACSSVQVVALAHKDALLEIEAVAVLS